MAQRLKVLVSHLDPGIGKTDNDGEKKKAASGTRKESLTVIDNRTGKGYELPVKNNVVQGNDLGKIKAEADQPGLRVYDPGYFNTASCVSRITYIDGDRGILEYRGYPIEELAEKSTFLEVSFLLMYGGLPSQVQLDLWTDRIMHHTCLHQDLVQMMKNFRYDSHPMGMLISAFAGLSTFFPDANPALAGSGIYKSAGVRNKQIFRILGKMPTVAACAYRQRIGRPYNEPVNHLNYAENFLYMLDRLSEVDYRPNPRLARALDILFILHADHELNCSTAAMRHLTSSGVDVYTATAGAAGALYGPLHGGANEAVLRMLESIGSVDQVAVFIEEVKAKKRLLMGFGHRVYKNYDPRAKIIRRTAEEVFAITGREPLIEVAQELERQALKDPYFIERKLYPNVDFYSGLIYKAMGFPTDMFPVLFAIPRSAGWLAHWIEQLDDPDRRIVRPQQVYLGPQRRSYVPMEQRTTFGNPNMSANKSQTSRRREAATSAHDA